MRLALRLEASIIDGEVISESKEKMMENRCLEKHRHRHAKTTRGGLDTM